MYPSALSLLFYNSSVNMCNLILLFSDHLADMNKLTPLFPFQNKKMQPIQVIHYFDEFHLYDILSVQGVLQHPFSVSPHHFLTLQKILYEKTKYFYFGSFYPSHSLLAYNIAYPNKSQHLLSLTKPHWLWHF